VIEYAPREFVRAGLRIDHHGRRVCVFCFQKSRLVMSDIPAELMFFFTGADILRSMGIAPCLIDRPLPLTFPGRPYIQLTDADARWLKACGVAWEPEPAFRLPLDLCQGHSVQQQDV
jgi:hypothetical protein